jgi:hypothetical protein
MNMWVFHAYEKEGETVIRMAIIKESGFEVERDVVVCEEVVERVVNRL